MLDVFILLLLPFIQIGVSFYISVQILASAIILISPRVPTIILNKWFFMGTFVAVLMMMETTLYAGSKNGDILSSARQGLLLAIMLGILRSPLAAKVNVKRIFLPLITVIAGATLLLLIFQSYMLSSHIYFGLPQSWFVINFETLPDELDLLYSKLRPSATFGEPSYLSLVNAVLLISLVPLWPHQVGARIAIILLAVGVFVSMSMLGLVVISLALTRIALRMDAHWKLILAAMIVLVMLAGSNYIVGSRIFERIGNIFSGQDYSSNARFLAPIRALPDILASYPIGIPNKIFRDLGTLPGMEITASEMSHNAFFNILISFGWLGVPIIGLLLSAPRTLGMRIIIFIMMMQNGAMMSFDKLAILYVAVMLENSIGARSRLSRSSKVATSRPYGSIPAE